MTSQLNKKIRTATLGFPRIGADRELKKAVEGYWKGKLTITELKQVAADIKAANWEAQKNISYIPSNDFSFYDHILDSIVLFGAVPERFKDVKFKDPLDLTFAMARGITSDKGEGCTALEMTKWFDTNYHYLVAEFSPDQEFKISSKKIIQDYLDAKNLGYETRPVLIGPVSFLLRRTVIWRRAPRWCRCPTSPTARRPTWPLV